MATLKLTYEEIHREVSRFVGKNRSLDSVTGDAATDISDAIRAGQRRFYFPENGYVWSFLAPTSDYQITNTIDTYDLPKDFIKLMSDFTYKPGVEHGNGSITNSEASARGAPITTIKMISPFEMRAMTREKISGFPRYITITPRDGGENGTIGNGPATDNGEAGLYEFIVFPVPDDNYVFQYQYLREPEAIDELNPFHEGSAMHSQTLLQACLLEVEERLRPENPLPNGPSVKFPEQLAASIEKDRTLSQAM